MGVAGGVPREQRPMPFAGGAGRTAGPVTIYVANKAGNTVTPIRAASNRAGRPIRVGPGPELIAISPDGETAYVVGVGSLLPEAAAPVTLTAIRTATNRPRRVITVCAPCGAWDFGSGFYCHHRSKRPTSKNIEVPTFDAHPAGALVGN